MDPMSSLLGTFFVAIGTVMVYGAYRNRRVFGAEGILAQAISKGSLVSLDSVPQAFEVGAAGKFAGGGAAGKFASSSLPPEVQDAVKAIAAGNQSLANNISAQLRLVDADSTRAEIMPLAQLLSLADAGGFSVSTAIIRTYVKDLTGESF